MLYIDINKHLNKAILKDYENSLKNGTLVRFKKTFLGTLRADYDMNKDTWTKYKNKCLTVVCLNDKHLYMAEIIAECYNAIGAKTVIGREFPYVPEDKVQKLFKCVEMELWAVMEYVMTTPMEDDAHSYAVEYLAKKLKKEYDLGNISELQYRVMARGCGMFEDYAHQTMENEGYDVSQDAEFGFYFETMAERYGGEGEY